MALLAVVAVSCGSKSNGNAPEGVETQSQVEVESEELQEADPTAVDHTAAISSAVEQMYSKAMALYANKRAENIDLSKIFYSNSLQELIRRTHKLEDATGNLILDWDLWVMAQDYDQPSAVVKSAKMIGQDKALVEVVITDNGERHVQVEVILEDGQWKINDLMNRQGGQWISTRKLLKKAVGD